MVKALRECAAARAPSAALPPRNRNSMAKPARGRNTTYRAPSTGARTNIMAAGTLRYHVPSGPPRLPPLGPMGTISAVRAFR